VFLTNWGWNSFLENAWRDEDGLEPARVLAVYGSGKCLLATEAGQAMAEAKGDPPAVGDWVGVRHGIVARILPRRTKISRRAPGARTTEQVIAANVDVLFVVSGLDGDYNRRRWERYLVLAAAGGAEALCVLTKADLCDQRPTPPQPSLFTSIKTGEGLAELAATLTPGRTGALVGSSGAGKSTLINWLLGAEVQAIGERNALHVTTRRELFRLPNGGLLIDTPGLREVQLWADEDHVAGAFSDIAELSLRCRFRDCRHQGEPGCAVRGVVSPDRLASFHKLNREVERLEAEQDIALRLHRRNALRALHRAQRRFYEE